MRWLGKFQPIFTAQKVEFSTGDFFSKCDQIRQETADSITFTEEILNGKHFTAILTAHQIQDFIKS